MTRISVVGCSGAGKTTMAVRLASALGIPHIELDALNWGPDWSAATDAEFASRVGEAMRADAWVIDGNYQNKIGATVWERADTVVWVDPPRWRSLAQVLGRTLCRVITRRQLWNGNRESWRSFLIWRGDESVLSWAWTSYPGIRLRYQTLMTDPCYAHITFHRVRTRREIDRLVRAKQGGDVSPGAAAHRFT